MTLEEAIAWCVFQCVEVVFSEVNDKPMVIIYLPDDHLDPLGRGSTLIEAVEAVQNRYKYVPVSTLPEVEA